MLRSFLLIPSIALLAPLGAFAQDAAISPDWTREDYRGNTVHLASAAKERPTLLFFWATWCPYCKALMPHLQSIRFEYGERVDIIAISIRDDEGDPAAYLAENGFDFTLIRDGDDIAAKNDVYGTPGLLLLDPDRRVRFNLYRVPRVEPPPAADASSNRRKAAFRAPYWAAEIRQALDRVIEDAYTD
jgi:thiol-disulfide isomerase/thioredoxin